jgi:hypothetical protein
MKTASNVFSIIGMIANVIVAICYTQPLLQQGSVGFVAVFWILAVLSIILGMCGLASSRKSVGLGVAMLISVNIFSGIFYLCWDDGGK